MKVKKLLAGILSAAMVLSSMALPAFATGITNNQETTPAETETVVAKIGTTEYTDLAEALNAAKDGGTVTLQENITLTGNWTPITGNFSGTLDGNNKTICGLTITNGTSNCGLLGILYGGTVKNLTIDGANITTADKTQYAGALFGSGWGDIENCTVSNSTITGYDQVGGLGGYFWIGTITGCTLTNNTIIATSERAGGILGKGHSAADNSRAGISIKNCTVSGGSVTAPDYAGGLMGQFMGDQDAYEISGNKVEKITLNAPKASAFATIRDECKTNKTFMGALQTKVTNNTFSTALTEALAAAEASGTFTLTAPITVPEDQSGMIPVKEGTYVFELNNHKLTGGIFNMGADVTIKDANIVTREYKGDSSQMVQCAAIAAYRGTTVVESGTFDSTNAVVQAQGGDVTLNDGTYILWSDLNPPPYNTYTVVKVSQQGSVTINGGTYKMAESKRGTPIAVEGGTVTINNGTFTSNEFLSILAHPENAATKAVVTVNGGTFEGGIVADPGSDITINGGEFTSSGTIYAAPIPVIEVYNDSSTIPAGKVTITGGTFTGEVTAQEGATLIITGGTFSTDVSAYVADGYIVVKSTVDDNTTYAVEKAAAKLENTNVTKEEKVETINNVVIPTTDAGATTEVVDKVVEKVVTTIEELPVEKKEEVAPEKIEEIIEAKKATAAAEAVAVKTAEAVTIANDETNTVAVTAQATSIDSSLELTITPKTTESNIQLPAGTKTARFEVTVEKTTTAAGEAPTKETVTETDVPILLKFTVEDAYSVKSVIRYHEGTQENVPFTIADNKTIMVSAAKFSEYVVTKKNTPTTGNAVLTFEDDAVEDGKCNIYLVGNEDATVTNFESGEFTIENIVKSGAVGIEINGAAGLTIEETADRVYRINRTTGAEAYPTVETGSKILLGTITLTGTGEGQIYAKNIQMNRKNVTNSLVVTIPTTSDYVTYDIKAATAKLTVNVAFPNAITNQVTAYQDMKITISGGDLADPLSYNLGNDASANVVWANTPDATYTLTVADKLTKNVAYTVKVEGAGYRTARYTVNMTGEKTLNFWNNVKDTAICVEEGVDTTKKSTTFLAGDIVKDNQINIYDLSAVVSYFGTTNVTTAVSTYAKYDLNRDGKIDSKDIAYVLVSWGN